MEESVITLEQFDWSGSDPALVVIDLDILSPDVPIEHAASVIVATSGVPASEFELVTRYPERLHAVLGWIRDEEVASIRNLVEFGVMPADTADRFRADLRLRNLRLGVVVSDQAEWDERVTDLMTVDCGHRFVRVESQRGVIVPVAGVSEVRCPECLGRTEYVEPRAGADTGSDFDESEGDLFGPHWSCLDGCGWSSDAPPPPCAQLSAVTSDDETTNPLLTFALRDEVVANGIRWGEIEQGRELPRVRLKWSE